MMHRCVCCKRKIKASDRKTYWKDKLRRAHFACWSCNENGKFDAWVDATAKEEDRDVKLRSAG